MSHYTHSTQLNKKGRARSGRSLSLSFFISLFLLPISISPSSQPNESTIWGLLFFAHYRGGPVLFLLLITATLSLFLSSLPPSNPSTHFGLLSQWDRLQQPALHPHFQALPHLHPKQPRPEQQAEGSGAPLPFSLSFTLSLSLLWLSLSFDLTLWLTLSLISSDSLPLTHPLWLLWLSLSLLWLNPLTLCISHSSDSLPLIHFFSHSSDSLPLAVQDLYLPLSLDDDDSIGESM